MAASRKLTQAGYHLGKTLVRPAGSEDAVPLEQALTETGGGTPGADASTALAAAQAAQVTADAALASAATANAALPLKAPLASPTFTGVPSAPTAAPGTDTTQLATMAALQAAIAALVNGAPATLDTLAEIAAALGNDAAFSATITAALGLKAPLASPTFTGTPAGPTAAPGTDTDQLATTAFARAAAAAAAAAALLNIPASDVVLASGVDLQTAVDQGTISGGQGAIAASGVINDSGLPGSSVAAALVALAAAKLDTTGNIAQAQVSGLEGALAAKQDKAPSSPVDFSGQRGINLATPTAASDAATRAYVDSVAQGLSPKGSCKAATTANVTLSGTQTIDGVALTPGDQVLVKNQSAAATNGIYVVAAGAWSRSADMDTWAETQGAFTFVVAGATQGSTSWVSQTGAGGTLGTSPITFTQSNAAGNYTFNGRAGPAFLPVAGDYSTSQITGISAYGQSLIDDASDAAARSTLGLGAAATRAIGTTAGTVPDGADPRFSTTSSFLNAVSAGGAIAVALAQTEVAIGSVTITPSSASSKVAIGASAEITKDTGTTARTAALRVRRGTLSSSPQVGQDGQGLSQAVASTRYLPRTIQTIDAPATTAPVTYTLFAAVLTAGASTAARYEITATELRSSGPSTGNVAPFGDMIEAPLLKPYMLCLYVADPFTLNALAVQMGTGTATVKIEKNGVPVTGLEGVAASTLNFNRVSATGNNSFVVGDRMTLTPTAVDGVNLSYSIQTTPAAGASPNSPFGRHIEAPVAKTYVLVLYSGNNFNVSFVAVQCAAITGTGSIKFQKNDVDIAGLTGISIGTASPSPILATGGNGFSIGDKFTAIVSGTFTSMADLYLSVGIS